MERPAIRTPWHRFSDAAALAWSKDKRLRAIMSAGFFDELEASRMWPSTQIANVSTVGGYEFRVDPALPGSQVYFEVLND